MKPLSQINVIPFIDVMLVLLAIVLMTATFVAQGKIPVDIPETAQTEALPTDATLELTIDEAGALYLDGAESALEVLALRLEDTPRETPVLLRVDRRAAFEHFVAVIEHLKARRMDNLSIVTRNTGG
jgi:biopolymer transport protein ExbD